MISKPLQFSFSFLSQYDNCPEAARHLYIIRDFKKTYTVSEGIDAHRELERRMRYKQPLPDALRHAEPLAQSLEASGKVEVEVSLAVSRDLTPSGFYTGYLRGKYDVVMRWPEARKAFIGDWKTGKVRESSDQLEIGAMLLMATDPAIDTVVGANLWLQGNRPGTPYRFTRAQKNDLWLKWLRRMQMIEAEDASKPWERRDGPLCGYCPVADCPHYRGA